MTRQNGVMLRMEQKRTVAQRVRWGEGHVVFVCQTVMFVAGTGIKRGWGKSGEKNGSKNKQQKIKKPRLLAGR